jgi:hypothetical protein
MSKGLNLAGGGDDDEDDNDDDLCICGLFTDAVRGSDSTVSNYRMIMEDLVTNNMEGSCRGLIYIS